MFAGAPLLLPGYSCTSGPCTAVQSTYLWQGITLIVCGFLLLIEGVVLAIPSRRARGSVPTTADQLLEKFCPTCGMRYSWDRKVCPEDSSELKAVQ